MLVREEIERALPANLKSAATQQLTDLVNNIASDPLVADNIRENFIGYSHVLKDGKFKTEDYLNAVAYVSYKLMGKTNLDAYCLVFPTRYSAMVAKGTPSKDIAAYVSAYNKGKLVNLIYEQSLVPTWVLNQDIYQQAINHQAYLMINSASEKVQTDAANSLLTHLKKPEIKEFQINMDVNESSGMNELKNTLKDLAQTQLDLMNKGVTAQDIAARPLIQSDAIDVTATTVTTPPTTPLALPPALKAAMEPPEPELEIESEKELKWG